jgi:hypothetical protein
MKATLAVFFLLAFVSVLLPCAMAQSGPPALCKPCLFYAGDFDPMGPNAADFPDENTLEYDNVKTYGAVSIPGNHDVLIEGILFQIVRNGVNELDPVETPWEIRTGVSEGSGGTLIASGQGVAHVQATGRFGNGPEYTFAVEVSPPVSVGGAVIWFNITPQCVEKGHNCESAEYSVSNTTLETNNFRGALQPTGQMYINSESDSYPYTWENWCNFTNPETCARLSFGLIGKILQ